MHVNTIQSSDIEYTALPMKDVFNKGLLKIL